MTKSIFPLIPLSHKESTEGKEDALCVWKGGVLSPPEGTESYMALLPWGPYSEARHMGVKEEYRFLLKQSQSQHIYLKKPLLSFKFDFYNFQAVFFRSKRWW